MSNKVKNLLLIMISGVMIFMAAAAFAVVWRFFYIVNYVWPARHWSVALVVLCAGVYAISSEMLGGYKLRSSRVSELIYSHIGASLITTVVMYVAIWMFSHHPWPEAWPLLIASVFWMVISVPWARIATRAANAMFPPVRAVVVYGNEIDKHYGKLITFRLSWRFERAGSVAISTGLKNVILVLEKRKAGAVVICGVHGDIRNELVEYCMKRRITVYIKPDIADSLVASAHAVRLNNFTMLSIGSNNRSVGYGIIKRIFDIVFSIFFLVLLSPLMLFAALIIKISDGGRVIYKQKRLTINRKVFTIYKFRTMRENSEENGPQLASVDDERITGFGRFLRAIRFDELPQLFNILRGDMSVVGPRPERPELAREFEKEIPAFALRLQVKAGLTGYAQVYGRYNTEPLDKLAMDLLYIADQSVFGDFKILLTTIKVIFIPESTEGISDAEREEYDREIK